MDIDMYKSSFIHINNKKEQDYANSMLYQHRR